MEPNHSIVNSYKKVLKDRNVGVISKPNPNVIIMTEMLSEYNYLSLTNEIELVKRISEIIIEKGLDVYIKPHPRETKNKYGNLCKLYYGKELKIIRQDIPIERVISEINPKIVIGFSSTALLTINLFYGIKSINITYRCMKNLNIMPINMIEFEKITINIDIYHIDNLEELIRYI